MNFVLFLYVLFRIIFLICKYVCCNFFVYVILGFVDFLKKLIVFNIEFLFLLIFWLVMIGIIIVIKINLVFMVFGRRKKMKILIFDNNLIGLLYIV